MLNFSPQSLISLLITLQVPEDLQSILGDQTLFNNPSDITTKEILKRYGDLGTNGGPRHQVETTETGGISPASRKERAMVTRVDTDPSQTYAWQKESSARQELAPYAGSSNQNTPPQQWQNPDHEVTLPFVSRNGNGTPDSQRERREYRNSGWGRPQNGGSVGITGAT